MAEFLSLLKWIFEAPYTALKAIEDRLPELDDDDDFDQTNKSW